MGNSLLAKGFKGTFESLKYSIAKSNISFQSPEAFYLVNQIYAVL